MLDLAIGVANSVGRSLLVYVEPPVGRPVAWLVELADSLWLRSIGLAVGVDTDRDASLRATGASAVLYEAPGPLVCTLPAMSLETTSLDTLVAADRGGLSFVEKVGRAASSALPVAIAASTLWLPYSVATPALERVLDAPPEESPLAAAELLRAVCAGGLQDRAALERLAVAIDAGMMPVERAVQSIVATSSPRSELEDALVIVCPPLRALRSMT